MFSGEHLPVGADQGASTFDDEILDLLPGTLKAGAEHDNVKGYI